MKKPNADRMKIAEFATYIQNGLGLSNTEVANHFNIQTDTWLAVKAGTSLPRVRLFRMLMDLESATFVKPYVEIYKSLYFADNALTRLEGYKDLVWAVIIARSNRGQIRKMFTGRLCKLQVDFEKGRYLMSSNDFEHLFRFVLSRVYPESKAKQIQAQYLNVLNAHPEYLMEDAVLRDTHAQDLLNNKSITSSLAQEAVEVKQPTPQNVVHKGDDLKLPLVKPTSTMFSLVQDFCTLNNIDLNTLKSKLDATLPGGVLESALYGNRITSARQLLTQLGYTLEVPITKLENILRTTSPPKEYHSSVQYILSGRIGAVSEQRAYDIVTALKITDPGVMEEFVKTRTAFLDRLLSTNSLGGYISDLIKKSGQSSSSLSKKIGHSESFLNGVMLGTNNLTPENFKALLTYLGVPESVIAEKLVEFDLTTNSFYLYRQVSPVHRDTPSKAVKSNTAPKEIEPRVAPAQAASPVKANTNTSVKAVRNLEPATTKPEAVPSASASGETISADPKPLTKREALQRIREFRILSGITTAEMARRTGVNQTFVSNWEAGRDKIPQHRLALIVKQFGFPATAADETYRELATALYS